MRLVINRNQQDVKGMLGGHKGVSFQLRYRLELTPEETDLVARYKLGGYPVTMSEFQGTVVPGDTIEQLVQGRTLTVESVTYLVQKEDIIKNGCDQLPVLFDVCRSFGGSEVIEYPRGG